MFTYHPIKCPLCRHRTEYRWIHDGTHLHIQCRCCQDFCVASNALQRMVEADQTYQAEWLVLAKSVPHGQLLQFDLQTGLEAPRHGLRIHYIDYADLRTPLACASSPESRGEYLKEEHRNSILKDRRWVSERRKGLANANNVSEFRVQQRRSGTTLTRRA